MMNVDPSLLTGWMILIG